MCTSIYIDIKIGELYTSQCSAGTVCLTCDSEKDSSAAHTQSVLFIFRGNNTICSWITKLYWLVILSMVLSWAAYYSAGRMSTCTDTVTDPLLPRHKHFKPVKLPWLRSRSGWRQRHNQLKQISFSIPMLIGWQLGQKKSVKTPEMLIVLQGKACNKPSQSFQCQEKAPFVYLGAFSVIVKSSRRFVSTSIARFMQRARWSNSI